MKRTYLSIQRLRRKKKELTNKGFKKLYHISRSVVAHRNAENSGPISSPNYANNVYKVSIRQDKKKVSSEFLDNFLYFQKCFVEPIRTDPNISACGSSWW